MENHHPFIIYGLVTAEGLRCLADECDLLHNQRQLNLPVFVEDKLDESPGYLLIPDGNLDALRRLLR